MQPAMRTLRSSGDATTVAAALAVSSWGQVNRVLQALRKGPHATIQAGQAAKLVAAVSTAPAAAAAVTLDSCSLSRCSC